MGFKFIRTPYESPYRGTDGKSVTIELDQDSDLDDMLEAFDSFLKASGYGFKGKVEIVEEQEEAQEQKEILPDEDEPTGC